MYYAVILAAGSGTRVKSIDIPKQYYEIKGIPIMIYTLRKFLNIKCIDYIYITVDKNYKSFMEGVLQKHLNKTEIEKITLVEGGLERIDSIHNVVKSIESVEINDDDLIMVHDAVRPFVSEEILLNSIKYAAMYGACVASLPVRDTIFESEKGECIENIPLRKTLSNGQSPDSFNLKKFIEFENKLTDEQKKNITGTSEIFILNNFPVRLIPGDAMNFKITNDVDLKFAEFLVNSSEE